MLDAVSRYSRHIALRFELNSVIACLTLDDVLGKTVTSAVPGMQLKGNHSAVAKMLLTFSALFKERFIPILHFHNRSWLPRATDDRSETKRVTYS
jgi:hypothetical protein